MFLSLVCFCTRSTPEGSIGSKVSITLTTTTNLHRVSRVFWGVGGGISQSKHLGTILNGIKTVVTMRNEGTYCSNKTGATAVEERKHTFDS